jgi:tetratricopeptide (TPR) repeat protein
MPRLTALVAAILIAGTAPAQNPPGSGETAIAMPFESSGAPGLEWIGEAFPIVLSQRLGSPKLYLLTRDDRLRAYDRMGIPAEVRPSRATIYRVAEQMGADFVVLGRYSFDGRLFTATAQILDMRVPKLLPEVTESGPLTDLINVQTALAWDLLHSLRGEVSISKQAFVNAALPIRLDAFENYVRGILAASSDEKVRRLSEAVRLNPSFGEAWLELGKAYYNNHDYAQAADSLGKVPASSAVAREANFYLGLAAYYQADFARAASAFNLVVAQLPLTEVYNNLGVVSARRGDKNATGFFQKAVQQDPNDADYHFNLAVSLYRNRDVRGAARELKQCLALHPGDSEARTFADALAASTAGSGTPMASTAPRVPLERIKRNYSESSFRQLFFEIQAAAEQSMANANPATRVNFYVGRGQQLLSQGFTAEAEKEFREAISVNLNSAEAHAGLARALEASNDAQGARQEAETALGLKTMAEPLLVLARLDLRDNKAEEAAQRVDRALQLEPNNASALALKRAVAAKLAEKAQPLPNE